MGHNRPADQAGLRRGNLALLVRTLRTHGALSRAQLAVRSGLSKATVSSLVTDLEQRGLVHSAGVSAGGQGRPGQLVDLRPSSACGVGLDLHVAHVGGVVTDLTGSVLFRRRVACDVPAVDPELALDQLAAVARDALAVVRAAGGHPAGVAVSVPGLVDIDAGVVRLAPRLRWREVPVADGLAARTGLALLDIAVDNDANLGAMAEHAGMPVSDLVYLTGDFGIGGGVICDGRLVRGALGFAGEIGHMSMDPLGPTCSCGRRGCWETQVGLGALLHACADPDDPVRDPTLDLDECMAIIRARAERGDRRTLHALHQIGSALGAGVSIVVNLLNPAVVVLGGYFAALPEWLVEPVRAEVTARVLAPGAGGVTVVGSRLGFTAATTGGALASLRRVLDDPTVVPLIKEEVRV
ncbi:MAG TPA: ROK family transcriptional regulator [Actinophytocola sp.]|uniref:ROK family transcriptional regulator n=1 Tax=Actinophytocola sp. TaxID=1872138 RepID=UPI002DDD5F5F|nr:ROK family transcriptional regulator [Actinophytocola sp.]HEV2779290.1 ROK family transcriptional regulator [Actinophytocola sp.]